MYVYIFNISLISIEISSFQIVPVTINIDQQNEAIFPTFRQTDLKGLIKE